MTDITQQSLQTAESISNYGLMTVIAAFFVVLSAIMMVAVFLWFKSIINRIIKQQDDCQDERYGDYYQLNRRNRRNKF
jgi:hypothetical protein